jgi:hypothetical protein
MSFPGLSGQMCFYRQNEEMKMSTYYPWGTNVSPKRMISSISGKASKLRADVEARFRDLETMSKENRRLEADKFNACIKMAEKTLSDLVELRIKASLVKTYSDERGIPLSEIPGLDDLDVDEVDAMLLGLRPKDVVEFKKVFSVGERLSTIQISFLQGILASVSGGGFIEGAVEPYDFLPEELVDRMELPPIGYRRVSLVYKSPQYGEDGLIVSYTVGDGEVVDIPEAAREFMTKMIPRKS